MDEKQHWTDVYGKKSPDQVSWYRPHLERSIRFIEDARVGDPFKKIASCREVHRTPWGQEQEFVYCYCRVARATPAPGGAEISTMD